MINRIGVENTSKLNSRFHKQRTELKQNNSNPSFKGIENVILGGIQACERMPMVNVAVIDMLSAILPRTIVESMTNWFAGFEAFRRESSGLFVNCLIPSFITLGLAKLFNNYVMPKGADLSSCWADSALISKASELYQKSENTNKVQDSLKNIISNLEGVDGERRLLFKEVLTPEEIEQYSKELTEITNSDFSKKEIKNKIKNISDEIISKTHIAENIKLAGTKDVKAMTVNSMLTDSTKFFKEFNKANKNNSVSMKEFAEQGKKLVKGKSIAGLAIVLPLAASMQYINRWITSKISGVKGAPIYEDFGKNQEQVEQTPKNKEGLFKQKLISISSMLGFSLLSMMKMPTLSNLSKMIEFKGIFPTMDQARIISTFTFASRMAAAEDKNELAEATVRDIATFLSLYCLGDYAAKGTATIIQNITGVTLLNDTKPISQDSNIFKKAWHWIKDVNIKSSEEVVSRTAIELKKKGLKPNENQLKTIAKELEKAKNYRAACQGTNIFASLALLGVIIPIFTRNKTKKQHEEDLKLAHMNVENIIQNSNTEKQIRA